MQLADPYCPHCEQEEETVGHFLLRCPQWSEARQTMFDSLNFLDWSAYDEPTALSALLGVHAQLNPSRREAAASAVDVFVRSTARFK
jgi:hypothetical protein